MMHINYNIILVEFSKLKILDAKDWAVQLTLLTTTSLTTIGNNSYDAVRSSRFMNYEIFR